MAYIFANGEFNDLLKDAWDKLAIFAYEQFLNHGRGLIGIDRPPGDDEFQFFYVTASQDATPNGKIGALVTKYDPETEIVINYAYAEDLFRTVQMKTSNERGPKAVWTEYIDFKNNGLKTDDKILD